MAKNSNEVYNTSTERGAYLETRRCFKNILKNYVQMIRKAKQLARKYYAEGEQVESWPWELSLGEMQHQYRIIHIAYCLARGKKYEEIEKPKSENAIGKVGDWSWETVEDLLAIMKTPLATKLYVVVNNKLSVAQQIIQAAHVVAEISKHVNLPWYNGNIVLLTSGKTLTERWGEKQLNSFCRYRYSLNQFLFGSKMKDPDSSGIGDSYTACAFIGPRRWAEDERQFVMYGKNVDDESKGLVSTLVSMVTGKN